MANDQHTELDAEQKLDQVKDSLIEHGKKRSSLTYKEIIEKLSPFDQDPEQIDEFFEQLDDLGIEVLNENDEENPLRAASGKNKNVKGTTSTSTMIWLCRLESKSMTL